ncbi:hypothetical protein E7703_19920 [Citrobacter portucalensis]|nr:hypothetical protein E7703_19920 [Citrobacter portucalensis]
MPENPASYRVVRTKSYLFNKAVRHLTLGKSATLHNQYVVSDAKWQFPSIATETSYLAINNIPTAIVFGSVSAS